MQKLTVFLQGKKTYLSAFVVAMAALTGWYLGSLNSTEAVVALGVAAGMCGLGAKFDRIKPTITQVLDDVRQAQQQAAAGHPVDAKQLAEEIAKHIGAQVIPGIVPVVVPGAVTNFSAGKTEK